MSEFSYSESPASWKEGDREKFFARLDENTIYCKTHEEYEDVTKKVFGQVPISGVSFTIGVGRDQGDFRALGYQNDAIFVDDEYYKIRFGNDFSEMLPYDLAHEKWEAYFSAKKGYNPDALDLKERRNRHFGRSHYLAIRKSLEQASKDGKLDDYLEWCKIQFGESQELANYRTAAERIKKKKLRL